ncbi:hypothetical protein HYT54_00850 [Candidatus Woesearchaeota archaeon]|nr:hypothetical protein [Candidatus Woesearchaeota archaeon]
MSETTFQKQVLLKLDSMEKNIHNILEYIEDSKLSSDEKNLLQESYKNEKEGKLISSSELAKKLRL